MKGSVTDGQTGRCKWLPCVQGFTHRGHVFLLLTFIRHTGITGGTDGGRDTVFTVGVWRVCTLFQCIQVRACVHCWVHVYSTGFSFSGGRGSIYPSCVLDVLTISILRTKLIFPYSLYFFSRARVLCYNCYLLPKFSDCRRIMFSCLVWISLFVTRESEQLQLSCVLQQLM